MSAQEQKAPVNFPLAEEVGKLFQIYVTIVICIHLAPASAESFHLRACELQASTLFGCPNPQRSSKPLHWFPDGAEQPIPDWHSSGGSDLCRDVLPRHGRLRRKRSATCSCQHGLGVWGLAGKRHTARSSSAHEASKSRAKAMMCHSDSLSECSAFAPGVPRTSIRLGPLAANLCLAH